ncbi:hypothetical protein ACI65C_013760, partial [Semiaphis heraclei]
KREAYDELIKFCKKSIPEANKDFVIKKIQSFRGSFRKELKKVVDSKRSGASFDDVYVPTLWYYDHLVFTIDQELPTESICNLMSTANTVENYDNDDASQVLESDNIEILDELKKHNKCNTTCMRRYDVEKLEDKRFLKDYNNTIKKIFEEKRIKHTSNVNEIWNKVKDSIETAATGVIGTKRNVSKVWFNNICEEAIRRRKAAREGLLKDTDNETKRTSSLNFKVKESDSTLLVVDISNLRVLIAAIISSLEVGPFGEDSLLLAALQVVGMLNK